jgi:hypothetical protein
VHYYLYSGSSFVADQEVATASTSATFEVNLGSYTVYAVTGTTCSITSETASLSTPFAFEPATDICIGHGAITVANSSQSSTISVAHMFSKVKMSITDVPGDVESITATISPVYDRFGWDGKLSQSNSETSASTTLTLTQNSKTPSTWESGTQYSYPSDKSATELNVVVTFNFSDNTYKRYSTTASTSLEAGKMYTLKTQYKNINSSLGVTTSPWDSNTNVDYNLGDNVTEGATIPQDHVFGYKYADNIMVIGEYSSTQLLVMYTTPINYNGDTYEYNLTNVKKATNIADWNVPTEQQWLKIVSTTANDLYNKIHAINSSITESDITDKYYYVLKDGNTFYKYNLAVSKEGSEETIQNQINDYALIFPVSLIEIK